jgi:DNA-binding NarL/FixJ family response regulator
MSDAPLRLVIGDDHGMVRHGLRLWLESLPDFRVEVLGEAENGEQVLELATELRPDVITMDLQMPGVERTEVDPSRLELGGLETIRRIVAALPETRVLALTMLGDDNSVFAALRAGAHGYVLKGVDQEELVRAIQAVASGQAVFSQGVAKRVLESFRRPSGSSPPPPFSELTPRQREILELVARGLSNSEIARQLGIQPKTVGNNVALILVELQARDRAAAIVRAREAGLGGITDR